jgi:hypothetical protein
MVTVGLDAIVVDRMLLLSSLQSKVETVEDVDFSRLVAPAASAVVPPPKQEMRA